MRTSPLTGVALLVTAGALLAGCAQPGQLGHEAATTPPSSTSTGPAPGSPGAADTDPGTPAPPPGGATDAPGAPAPPGGAPGAPGDPASPAGPGDPAVPPGAGAPPAVPPGAGGPGAPADPAAPAATPGAPGAPAPADGAGPGGPGVPPPVAQAGSDARGSLDRPVDIRTPGPAELLVRTEVLQPGQATGWVRHPGTVTSAVRSGTVTVQRAGGCEPQGFGSGQAFFLGDGEPNLLRNDGPDPVVLTRSELLAPGAPEREPTTPAC
ncbi:hypothetical protein H7X46_25630 [Pseudonocardia sp. C8]|uniref:cupin domain-containing protein n=1 Tax=Pseudonocardia sp. C8 TaxID=2762759 RepID=UPI0016432853|nr:hypothetical protein [Pseudonocardia sp. C8]MBC3194436.1 hypothetical protein [Pseudonocardia sp. C8]